MLKIEDLHVQYGGIQALRGISLEVPDGRIVTLIGANGAGKSTTLRTITGLVKASSGSIQWNGQELLGKSIDKIVSSGIAMSPEGPHGGGFRPLRSRPYLRYILTLIGRRNLWKISDWRSRSRSPS